MVYDFSLVLGFYVFDNVRSNMNQEKINLKNLFSSIEEIIRLNQPFL